MVQKLRERLILQANQNFIGRKQEIAHLNLLLSEQRIPVVFIYGIRGVGKTSLLEACRGLLQAGGAAVVSLDCRAIDPNSDAFLSAVSTAAGGSAAGLEAAALRLSALAPRVVLAFDSYEALHPLDAWIRQVFVPALDDHVQILFSGREAPDSAWFTASGWNGMVRTLALGPLTAADAEELLRKWGVSETDARCAALFTQGHPLALKLAAATIAERPELHLKEVESQYVLNELARLYLSDVHDPTARAALEACSVVRRTTRSLLQALLPDLDTADAFDRLRGLACIDSASDGLRIQPMVQKAVAGQLRADDPERYHLYRRAAWNQLRTELSAGIGTAAWRYTADCLYLVDNPLIHAAFFQGDALQYTIEQAQPNDLAAVRAMTLRHDGPETAQVVEHWWSQAPQGFFVARGRHLQAAGYACLLQVPPGTRQAQYSDPITRHFWQHLAANPVPNVQSAVFRLKSLAEETADLPSTVQGSLWLELERFQVENHQTRRIYSLGFSRAWIPVLEALGFCLIGSVVLDGKEYFSMAVDFGPRLLAGWLAGLLDDRPDGSRPVVLDIDARALLIDGTLRKLTCLEFKLVQYLNQNEGKAIPRDEILNRVWGYEYAGGSNVVDAIVRSLRKKLGDQAGLVETVAGVGYRMRGMEIRGRAQRFGLR